MGTPVGEVDLSLVLQSAAFQQQLSNAVNTALNGVNRTASGGLTAAFKKLGGLIGGVFAVKGIINFGKRCTELGSDLAEIQNVVDVTFSQMSDKVNFFSQKAIANFGLSEAAAKEMMGTFGAMSKAFNFTEQQAYDMSSTLAGLSGDVASFYNKTADEAQVMLKSVFTGETESLKNIGVVMTQNALDQYALSNGYKKTTAAMSEQEKVALRFAFVVDKLSLASGDFVRTQDGWANQTRILKLNFESFMATVGQGLINVFLPVVKLLNTLISKLQVVAEAFKNLTGGDAASAGLAGMADNAMDASNAITDVGDSTAAAAKKVEKSLMGFDKLNKLSAPTDTSGADTSTGAGMGAALGTGTSEAVDKSMPKLNKLKQKLLEIAELFKKGFAIGFGDTDFQNIKKHIDGIGGSLKKIFGNSDLQKSAKGLFETIVTSLGKVTGAASSIGVTIGEFLLGSLDKYLQGNGGFISDSLTAIMGNMSGYYTLVSDFTAAVAEIFAVFRSPEAKEVGANLMSMIITPLLTIVQLGTSLIKDISSLIIQPIIKNKDKIATALRGTLRVVRTLTGTMRKYVEDTAKSLKDTYDKYIGPAFKKISEAISSLLGTVLDFYNKHLQPLLQRMAEKIDTVYTEHIKPAIDSIIKFFGKLINTLSDYWQNWLMPCIQWIIKNILPVVIPVLENIWDKVCLVAGVIFDLIKGLFDRLGGFMDFLSGVFTGDWDKAWNGIKSIFDSVWETIKKLFGAAIDFIKLTFAPVFDFFAGIWNKIKGVFADVGGFFSGVFEKGWGAIKTAFSYVKGFFEGVWEDITGVFADVGDWFGEKFQKAFDGISKVFEDIKGVAKGVINFLIDGINKLTRGLNEKINVELPDWLPGDLGGKTIGFAIPEIPRLANGGYVKPNTPQLAVIGDNRRYGEIVAPEDKLFSTVLSAIQAAGTSKSASAETIQVVVNLGNENLVNKVIEGANKESRRLGKLVFNV